MATVLVVVLSVLVVQGWCFVLDGAKLPQFSTYGRSMVLVGGHLDDNNAEIYNSIINMAGGRGKAKMGLIHAASADPQDSYAFYQNLFLNVYGAKEVNFIPIDVNHTSANRDPAVLALIRQQTGFFFGGGDQYRITESFFLSDGHPSPALQALRTMYEAGAVISGSSAGTTCQTNRIMVRSGVSYEALKYGAHGQEPSDIRDALVYRTGGGLGFLQDYVLDTHFSQRGREGRMIRLLSDTRDMSLGSPWGIGIDENTALVVSHADTDKASAKVIGAAGVSIFDLSKSTASTLHSYFSIRDVYMTYLTHGDVYNLRSHDVTFSPTKTPLRGHENYDHALTTNDVFYGSRSSSNRKPEFVRIATSIFDARVDYSTTGSTYESHPRFQVTLSRTGQNAEGFVERKSTFHTDITSYRNMYVEISVI